MYKSRILIIEDEAIVAIHLKKVLENHNYEITGILPSGEEAIEFTRRDIPDLILMDIQLSGKMDGIDTASKIKDISDIPIIYLTAYSDEKTLIRAKITEPFGYVVKPFVEKELYGSIEMALFKSASEKKLKEAEERYRSLLNSSFYLIYIHDFSGNLLDANPTAMKILDIPHFEIDSINIDNFIAPRQLPQIYSLIEGLKNNNKQTDINDLEIKARNGVTYFLDITGSLVYKNNQPYAVQIIGRDVTLRKSAQEELLKSELKYRSLIERLNEGLIQVDNSDVIQFVNLRYCEIVGYKPEELIGKVSYKLFILERDWEFIRQKNRDRIERKTDKYELQYKKKNGEIIWVEISAAPVFDGFGHVTGSFALITDISERKKADQAISHLAAIVESSQDAIISKDLDGTIISWNKGAESMYGYSYNEIVGKNITLLSPPELSDEMNIILGKLRKGQKLSNFETVRIKKDGTRFFVSLTISPIVNSNGKIISISTIARDITEFKRALYSIIISEKKYKDLFEYAPAGIFQAELKGTILTANSSLSQILGYSSAGELINKNLADDIFCIKEQFYTLSNEAQKTAASIEKELQCNTYGGKVIWIQLTLHYVMGAEENLHYLEGFVRDITAHKTAEQVLIEQEQSYRSLVETSNDAIYVLQGRRLILVNYAWENMFGYTAAEAMDADFNIMKIVAPESVHFIESRFNKQQSIFNDSPSSTRYEFTGISKSGRLIQIEVSVSEIIWRGKPAVQGIYRDITERKKTEEQIRMLSLAVKQSSASIIITNTRGRIEYVNPKFSLITGYSQEEVIGKSPAILSTENLSEKVKKEITNTLRSGKEWKGEFLNKKKNGEFYWESATISPIMDDDGTITHFLSVQEDITTRKKQEQQLIIAKENAEKSDKLKTEFLAQMSHEIRTPLNNILTYSSVLKEEFEDKLPEGLESTFQVIDSSSQRLIRTIELILNLSRIQTGNYETYFERTNLSDNLLEDIILEFYSRARQKNISLNYKNNAEHFIVMADRYSLSQVFINLIDNALKYTEEGSIDIEMYNVKDKVCIDIRDSGIGISSEYLSRLFNPFSQEDSGLTRHFEGIGLGLALVKKYVEINNADIKVKSEKGRGSIFTVTLEAIS